MSLLLDTHALLWALTDPSQLGQRAEQLLLDPGSELWVSAASAWELATKSRLGKLPQADVVLGGYSRHLFRLGVRELPITSEHSLFAGRLDWEHRDPFDRMIAAQSMLEGFSLITRDRSFHRLQGIEVLW